MKNFINKQKYILLLILCIILKALTKTRFFDSLETVFAVLYILEARPFSQNKKLLLQRVLIIMLLSFISGAVRGRLGL